MQLDDGPASADATVVPTPANRPDSATQTGNTTAFAPRKARSILIRGNSRRRPRGPVRGAPHSTPSTTGRPSFVDTAGADPSQARPDIPVAGQENAARRGHASSPQTVTSSTARLAECTAYDADPQDGCASRAGPSGADPDRPTRVGQPRTGYFWPTNGPHLLTTRGLIGRPPTSTDSARHLRVHRRPPAGCLERLRRRSIPGLQGFFTTGVAWVSPPRSDVFIARLRKTLVSKTTNGQSSGSTSPNGGGFPARGAAGRHAPPTRVSRCRQLAAVHPKSPVAPARQRRRHIVNEKKKEEAGRRVREEEERARRKQEGATKEEEQEEGGRQEGEDRSSTGPISIPRRAIGRGERS